LSDYTRRDHKKQQNKTKWPEPELRHMGIEICQKCQNLQIYKICFGVLRVYLMPSQGQKLISDWWLNRWCAAS
jgi:hypothetical protein